MKKYSSSKLLLTLIFTLTVSSIFGLISSQVAYRNINKIGAELAPLIDACMEIKVTTTEAHLWLEEVLTEYESPSSFDFTRAELKNAMFYVNAILEGGSNEEGDFLPITSDIGRNETERVDELIHEFEILAIKRYENKDSHAIDDTELDKEFDIMYKELIMRIDRVETIIQKEMTSKLEESRINVALTRIFFVIVILFILVVTTIYSNSVKVAHDSSPLTGLPGNVTINKMIEKTLNHHTEYSVVYSDLDNFKAFNDKYGFSRGDEVLKFTSELLVRKIHEHSKQNDFVGHIGGDDFVFITNTKDITLLFDNIIQNFDEEILNMYRKNDVKDGKFISTNRNGSKTLFPVISISLAAVQLEDMLDKNHLEVIDACTVTKKKAKKTSGSCYIIYEA